MSLESCWLALDSCCGTISSGRCPRLILRFLVDTLSDGEDGELGPTSDAVDASWGPPLFLLVELRRRASFASLVVLMGNILMTNRGALSSYLSSANHGLKDRGRLRIGTGLDLHKPNVSEFSLTSSTGNYSLYWMEPCHREANSSSNTSGASCSNDAECDKAR